MDTDNYGITALSKIHLYPQEGKLPVPSNLGILTTPETFDEPPQGASATSQGVENAIAFLRELDADGWHHLWALHPETGKRIGRTFKPDSWEAMRDWIAARISEWNLYYSVNEPRPKAPHKKLEEADIGRMRAVHIDVDPKKEIEATPGGFDAERERIRKSLLDIDPLNAPSFIIDSGGGFQALWKLAKKLDASEFLEATKGQSRALGKMLGGDNTHNADRVLRLPGTINYPDAKKKGRGRTPKMASRLDRDGDVHDLTSLAEWVPPLPVSQKTETVVDVDMGAVRSATTYDELSADLRSKFDALRKEDPRVESLWKGDRSALPGEDASRSGFAFSLAIVLRRSGKFAPTELGQLLFVWDQQDPERVDARYIERAWSRNNAASAEEEFEPVEIDETKMPPKKRSKLYCERLYDITAEETEQPPLIEDWFDQGTMVVTYGESGKGKTHVVLSQAIAIATGREWARKKTERGLVIYAALEGGRSFRKRLAAWKMDIEVTPSTPFLLMPCPIDLWRTPGDTGALIELVKETESAFGQKCRMIVVDTLFRALAGGNENAPDDMGAFVMHCDRIRDATGATIHLVHHSGKKMAAGARGHSSLRAATDTEIEIVNNTVIGKKQRDMEEGRQIPFTLKTVSLGLDRRGRPRTTAMPIFGAEADFGMEPKITSAQESALRALKRELLRKAGVDPSHRVFTDITACDAYELTSSDTTTMISTPDWKAACRAGKPPKTRGLSDTALEARFGELAAQDLVVKVGEGKGNNIRWMLSISKNPERTPNRQSVN